MSLFEGLTAYFQNGLDLCGNLTTINGNTTTNNAGRFDWRSPTIYLDGSGDYVTFPSSGTIGTGDFTLIIVFKRDGALADNGFVSLRDATYSSGEILDIVWASSQLRITCPGISGEDLTTSSPTDLTWYIGILQRKSGTIKFYLNGTETYSKSSVTNSFPALTLINIGQKDTTTPGSMFKGYFDEVILLIGTSPDATTLNALLTTKYIYPYQRGERGYNDS